MSDTINLGAQMADLVAAVHALVTEDERGIYLDQRVCEINATAMAICDAVARIAATRNAER